MRSSPRCEDCSRSSYLAALWCGALLCGALLVGGCERSAPVRLAHPDAGAEAASAPAFHQDAPRDAAPLTLRAISVAPLPDQPLPEWVPAPEAITSQLERRVRADPALALSDEAKEAATLHLAYSVSTLTVPQQPARLVMSVTLLTRAADGSATAPITRLAMIEQTPEAPGSPRDFEARFEALCEEALEGLSQRHQIATLPDEALIARALRDDAPLASEAALLVTQRLRARVKDLPEQRGEVANVLKRFVKRDDPELVMAAVGGLLQLDVPGLGPLLVDAAERMSALGQAPALVALLAQMGDVDDPVVHVYLETVSREHLAPQIRAVAEESLRRLEKKQQ